MSKDSFLSRAFNSLFHSQTHLRSDESQTKQGNDVSNNISFTPTNVMKALGVEILENGKDGYYLVGFQGGVFVLFFQDDRLNVMYNDVLTCSYSDSVKASLIANEINSAYSVWSCYLHISNHESDKSPIKVCFSQMFPLTGNFKVTTEFIHGVMSSAFSIGRDFRERFKKAQDDKSNLTNILNRKDFVNKLELAKRLIEVQNFEQIKDEMPPASYLRIETLADLFDDTEFGSPQSLKIITNDQLEIIRTSDEVVNFDIRAYVRNHPKREDIEHITLITTFYKQDLIISLKKMPGSSSKSLFFALNIMRSGVEDDIITHNRSLISCRDTIEIRLTTEQEDYWEVKYMLDEARDKHAKNDFSSLTDEQKMLLIQLAPNIQDDLYWGFKFFNEDCLFQSLFYFKRVYYHYSASGKRSKRDNDILGDISLYIGIVYCQLKRYELAYYYLDKSPKYDSILASEWYINCLCSLNDSQAYRYIKHMLESVNRNIEDNDVRVEDNQDFFSYYQFLKRRLVHVLIHDSRLTEAENLISQMLERKENIEFCQREQEVIRNIRLREAQEREKNIQRQHKTSTQLDVSDDDTDIKASNSGNTNE